MTDPQDRIRYNRAMRWLQAARDGECSGEDACKAVEVILYRLRQSTIMGHTGAVRVFTPAGTSARGY